MNVCAYCHEIIEKDDIAILKFKKIPTGIAHKYCQEELEKKLDSKIFAGIV